MDLTGLVCTWVEEMAARDEPPSPIELIVLGFLVGQLLYDEDD